MRGVVMHAPGDVRVEDRERPDDHRADRRDHPPGRDLHLRLRPVALPRRRARRPPARWATSTSASSRRSAPTSTTVKVGDFVVGSFFASDNTCEICQAGYQSRCVHAESSMGTIGTQAEYARIPLADGTLVATPGMPDADLIPSLLAASDVLGTGWFAAVAAEAGPGKTVAVVGDGAVGLLGILAAKQLGAERIIAMSAATPTARRWPASSAPPTSSRSAATRASPGSRSSPTGSARTRVIEAVGTQESMMQAIRSTRPGGHVGYVGVSHDVALARRRAVLLRRPPPRRPRPRAPVPARAHPAHLGPQDRPRQGLRPTLPLDQAAEGYRAMDERRATKVLLRP